MTEAARQLRSQCQGGTMRPDSAEFHEAACLAAEALRRTMGFRLHDVQLLGAMSAAQGAIIEMQTGEGKTVVCGMVAALRAMFDASVHVATTNEYLAERDLETVQPSFELLGLSSGILAIKAPPQKTRAAYRKAITYGPGYLFGFDYLRDQVWLRDQEAETVLGRDVLLALDESDPSDALNQLRHDSIIVDEADSVMLDEATTPLILSGSESGLTLDADSAFGYELARLTSEQMRESDDYEVDESRKRIQLTSQGLDRIHESLAIHGKVSLDRPWRQYIENALHAQRFLIRDEHYVVQKGEINLVDQFTGRIFEDRTLRGGLHQAVEAKESVAINPAQRTLARITRQRFFDLYATVCGMTGTASESAEEIQYFYQLPVLPFSPHQPCQRVEHTDRFFLDWDSKFNAICGEITRRHATGQPLLIGTTTIRESLMLYERLKASGLRPDVLNGVQDASEAEIVAAAGQPGRITVATNMAGRGTDIRLDEASRRAGGLHVIGTQRQLSRRIDRQLIGRSARQGDPGSSQFFLSVEDDLIQQYDPGLGRRMAAKCDADGICRSDYTKEVEELQRRVTRNQFEVRRMLVQHDNWLDRVRETMAQD